MGKASYEGWWTEEDYKKRNTCIISLGAFRRPSAPKQEQPKAQDQDRQDQQEKQEPGQTSR